jgi:hypothetical protein
MSSGLAVMQPPPLGAPSVARRPSLLQIPPGVSFALDSPALLPMNLVRARAGARLHAQLQLPGLLHVDRRERPAGGLSLRPCAPRAAQLLSPQAGGDVLSLFGASGFAAAKKLASSAACEADPGVPPASDARDASQRDAEALQVRGARARNVAARSRSAAGRGGRGAGAAPAKVVSVNRPQP